MKVKVLVATLFASFALVAYGNPDNSSNVEEANSLGKPATTGYSGAGSPIESQPKEAEANEASSDDVVEKMSGEDAEEELPGAVEQAMGDDNPLSAIPRDDLPKECLDYFQELEDRLYRFPEAREAAMKAAEELRASFESMEGDLEQFAQTCQERYEDFKKANAQLDERIKKEGAPE
jgi:phage shock protein A